MNIPNNGETVEYFMLVKSIEAEIVVPVFLSIMGVKTFNLLRSLVQPGNLEISPMKKVKILGNHYAPKPLIS